MCAYLLLVCLLACLLAINVCLFLLSLQTSAQACGAEGGPCCISTAANGSPQASCSSGLACIPPSIGWASKAQLEALAGGAAAAVGNTAVMGTCRKFAAKDCGKAYMPCGKDLGEQHTHSSSSSSSCSTSVMKSAVEHLERGSSDFSGRAHATRPQHMCSYGSTRPAGCDMPLNGASLCLANALLAVSATRNMLARQQMLTCLRCATLLLCSCCRSDVPRQPHRVPIRLLLRCHV
jgi:hypothetical protein